jgi:hypothetical protein
MDYEDIARGDGPYKARFKTHEHKRDPAHWTHKEYGPSSPPRCYDLAETIKAYLKKTPKYEKLSMCEVVMVEESFRKMRPFVTRAAVFWSHAQAETVETMLVNIANAYVMLEEAGDPDFTVGLDRPTAKSHFAVGHWNKVVGQALWLDLFSLRQGQSDFHVAATLELIQDMGDVGATVNDGYLTRSFCLMEACAAVMLERRGTGLSTDRSTRFYLKAPMNFRTVIDSANASCRDPHDEREVREYIKSTFRHGASTFVACDAALQDYLGRSRGRQCLEPRTLWF